MSFKNLMIIKALVCLTFGILMLAVPDKLFSIFGCHIKCCRNVSCQKGRWCCTIWKFVSLLVLEKCRRV